MSPKEAIKIGNICPICRKKMTIGVQHRVEELADRDENYVPKNFIPFKKLIPLTELISAAMGIEDLYAKQIWEMYHKLVTTFNNEYNTLLNASKSDIEAVANQKIAELILNNREGRIKIKPGFDGVYGKIILDEKDNKERGSKQVEQKRLDGFFK
jgi:PHP family Zn ribbon phosphoesterase